MINRIDWECKFNNLDINELTEIENILLECKQTVYNREEFIDMLKRFNSKYPQCKYFCVGYVSKGAYECEGEWNVRDWDEIYGIEYIWKEFIDYAEDRDEEHGDVEILLDFNSQKEWENSIVNLFVNKNKSIYQEFKNSLCNCIHVPGLDLDDASSLNNGDTMYKFIEISTGEEKYLYTNEYY